MCDIQKYLFKSHVHGYKNISFLKKYEKWNSKTKRVFLFVPMQTSEGYSGSAHTTYVELFTDSWMRSTFTVDILFNTPS